MLDIFLQTLPFFAIIAVGFGAAKIGMFPPAATVYLTKFVFYFALSSMLFSFSAGQKISTILNWDVVMAYLCGTIVVYVLATVVAMIRRIGIAEGAIEAQCAVIGNVGFLGIPLLALLLGPQALGPILLVLSVDLLVFSSLIVILITGSQQGRVGFAIFATIFKGLVRNPMIVAIALGFVWSGLSLPLPTPFQSFLDLLGGAATPGALFAIGASLAPKSSERFAVAGWLSFAKLFVHPLAVAVAAFWVFDLSAYNAGVIVAASALPVAGNVFMLAQHYGVAPQRASASILISTVFSILTVSLVVAWVSI